MEDTPTWAIHLKHEDPHLPTCDSCKLIHVSKYGPTTFIWFGWMPTEPPRISPWPTNIAQARPIFIGSTVMCCWAERRNCLKGTVQQDFNSVF